MLRATTSNISPLLGRLTIGETSAKCGQTDFALEFVRWRKPRWVPIAKSKLFRVPERREQDPDEQAELKRLHNNYNTQLRSVRQYLRKEVQRLAETSTADHYLLTPEQEAAEYQQRQQLNEEWNKQSASVRAQRLAQQREERASVIKRRLELARERDEEELERVEATVRREKELAKTYITREKLDDAIAQALANPIDYNFSIDLQGNIYQGRTTVPAGRGSATPADGEQLQATN